MQLDSYRPYSRADVVGAERCRVSSALAAPRKGGPSLPRPRSSERGARRRRTRPGYRSAGSAMTSGGGGASGGSGGARGGKPQPTAPPGTGDEERGRRGERRRRRRARRKAQPRGAAHAVPAAHADDVTDAGAVDAERAARHAGGDLVVGLRRSVRRVLGRDGEHESRGDQ